MIPLRATLGPECPSRSKPLLAKLELIVRSRTTTFYFCGKQKLTLHPDNSKCNNRWHFVLVRRMVTGDEDSRTQVGPCSFRQGWFCTHFTCCLLNRYIYIYIPRLRLGRARRRRGNNSSARFLDQVCACLILMLFQNARLTRILCFRCGAVFHVELFEIQVNSRVVLFLFEPS